MIFSSIQLLLSSTIGPSYYFINPSILFINPSLMKQQLAYLIV